MKRFTNDDYFDHLQSCEGCRKIMKRHMTLIEKRKTTVHSKCSATTQSVAERRES